MKLHLDAHLRHLLIELEDGDLEQPLVRWDVEPLGVLEVVPLSADYLVVEIRPLREGVARVYAVLLDSDVREEHGRSAHYIRVHPDNRVSTAPVSASMSIEADPDQPTQGGITGG